MLEADIFTQLDMELQY